MKPRAFKWVAAIAFAGWLTALSTQAEPGTPTPATISAKTADSKKGKNSKPRADTGDSTLPPKKQRGPKEIQFPVPIGQGAHDVTVPTLNDKGILIQLLHSLSMHRIDNENVQMDSTTLKLNDNNGQEAYQVILPTCVFNLKTNIVTSKDPVTVDTKDFELTGERMEFNAVERSGELHGRVHMVIHNFKQMTTPGQPSADLQ